MADKKKCVGCSRAIPTGAHNCVFCGARQPVAELKLTAFLSTIRDDLVPPPEAAKPGEAQAAGGAAALVVVPEPTPPPVLAPVSVATDGVIAHPVSDVSASTAPSARRATGNHRSQTENTVLHLEEAARRAMAMAAAKEAAEPEAPSPVAPASPEASTVSPAASASAAARSTPARAPVIAPRAPAALRATAALSIVDAAGLSEAPATRAPAVAFPSVMRAVMTGAGALLLVLFAMNASLLGVLAGNPLVLAIYELVGGLILVGGGLLPLPSKVRAVVAALAGAVPLFVAPPLVELDGWRGLAAALVILLLPGALLLRQRVTGSLVARVIVVGAIGVAALVYLAPVNGVMPLRAALGLLATGQINEILVGAITLAPLLLVAGTLTALLPRSSSGFGAGWAILLLLAVSGSVMVAGHGDQSLVQLGIAILAAGAAAAVGVAQLLDVANPST